MESLVTSSRASWTLRLLKAPSTNPFSCVKIPRSILCPRVISLGATTGFSKQLIRIVEWASTFSGASTSLIILSPSTSQSLWSFLWVMKTFLKVQQTSTRICHLSFKSISKGLCSYTKGSLMWGFGCLLIKTWKFTSLRRDISEHRLLSTSLIIARIQWCIWQITLFKRIRSVMAGLRMEISWIFSNFKNILIHTTDTKK